MALDVDVTDLRLVDAIARGGSLGAAARELRMAQPSASKRLAGLERRLGGRLFDRDTTGARLTSAGAAFVSEARHILHHLAELPDRTATAADWPRLRVGALPSLAPIVFPLLVGHDPAMDIYQTTGTGSELVAQVAHGGLDAALVAATGRLDVAPTLTVRRWFTDPLVRWTPADAGADASAVVYHCVDDAGPEVAAALTSVGVTPVRACTAATAIAMGRVMRWDVVVGRAMLGAHEGSVRSAPIHHHARWIVVSRGDVGLRPLLSRAAEALGVS